MKNNKGFTLVEVIISIAALGIICAVLLRLFVIAGDTSDKASAMQEAEMYVTSATEELVCADTIHEALESLGIDSAGEITNETFTYTKDGCDIVIELEEKENGYPGTLYDIRVSALDGEDELAAISTAKYYKEQADD